MALIEFSNVSFTYPLTERPALRNIDLRVEAGEFVAIIGADGSGRSSLCYAISGFIPHFYRGELTGDLWINGQNTRDLELSEMCSQVGLVFQDPFNQISGAKFTVREEIAFGLENLGVPASEMAPQVAAAMEQTGISRLADKSPFSLSGGQQQRVALASMLVMKPKILVLDEPTAQLDPRGALEVFNVISGLRDEGITIIIVEQKSEWIAEYADRVIAMRSGEIVLDGSPRAALTDPLLKEGDFPLTQYTRAAALSGKTNTEPLPTTLNQAVEWFKR